MVWINQRLNNAEVCDRFTFHLPLQNDMYWLYPLLFHPFVNNKRYKLTEHL